jgi:hypothetical protein
LTYHGKWIWFTHWKGIAHLPAKVSWPPWFPPSRRSIPGFWSKRNYCKHGLAGPHQMTYCNHSHQGQTASVSGQVATTRVDGLCLRPGGNHKSRRPPSQARWQPQEQTASVSGQVATTRADDLCLRPGGNHQSRRPLSQARWQPQEQTSSVSGQVA